MINYHTVIGLIAGLLAFIGYIPYIWSIFHHKTKPHRTTFAIWSLLGVITISSYIASGARSTIWIGLAYALLSTFVFILSFKYGVGGFSKLDITCLLGAILGISLWVVTRNPQTALYITIAVDLIGTVPTFKKAYLQPETEDTLAWGIDSIGAILNFFALTSYSLHLLAYPLFNIAGSGLVTTFLLIPRIKRNKKARA